MDSSALANAESWLKFFWYFKLIAAFLVAVGVAMEFGGDWISSPFEKTVDEARKLEIVRLGNETETLRSKNLDMESAVAPRILEQGLTSASLKKFAGTQFLVVSPTDFEPKRAAGQIRAMLSMAGRKKLNESIGPQQYPFFDGVVIHTLGDRVKAKTAADALVSILNASKITTRDGYPMVRMGADGKPDIQSIMNRSGPTVIIVEVGPKPLPPSMQLKPEDIPADARGNKIWGNIEE